MVSRGYRKLKEKKINKQDCQNSCHTAKDLMSAFHIFDAQNKGYIESHELREALGLTGAGIPDDELRQMLQETGLLADRKITFAEFIYLMSDSSTGEDSRSQETRRGSGPPPSPLPLLR